MYKYAVMPNMGRPVIIMIATSYTTIKPDQCPDDQALSIYYWYPVPHPTKQLAKLNSTTLSTKFLFLTLEEAQEAHEKMVREVVKSLHKDTDQKLQSSLEFFKQFESGTVELI